MNLSRAALLIFSSVLVLLGFARVGYTANEIPNAFTLSGQLYNSPSTIDPLLDSSIVVRVQILDPSKNCILYDEQQTVNTMDTEGTFDIQVGSSVGAIKRVGGSDPGISMVTVFQNVNAMTATCAGNSYTPSAGAVRYLRIIVTPSSTGLTETLSPDILLGSVPTALVAERAENLQGLSRTQVLQLGTVADLLQANVETVFSATNYPKLLALLGGSSTDYVRSSTTAGAPLPSLAAPPGSPTTGNVWYNSTSNTIQYYNGTTTHTLGTVAGTITALTGDVSASGTGSVAATVNSVGGSTAANIRAAELLANAATAANTASAIVRRDASGNFVAGTVSTSGAQLRDATTNTVTLAAPAAVTSYTLRFPSAQGGAGETLKNDGSGNLSWAADGLTTATAFSGDVSGAYNSTSVDKIKGVAVGNPTSAGQVLRFDGTDYTPNFVAVTDLRSNVTGTTALAATCTPSQTLTYNTAMDNLACTDIAIPHTAVSGIEADFFVDGGNTFGAAASIGTADANNLNIVTGGAARITVLAGGNVGIGDPAPGYPLSVTGDINSSTSLRVGGIQVCTSAGCNAVSDQSLKRNVLPLDNALDSILKLVPVRYEWKDPKLGDKPQIGFIAQEVEKVFPEVVRRDASTGLKSVAYDHLAAPLVRAVQALHERIVGNEAVLEQENARLREQITQTSQELASVKSYLCAQDPHAPFCQNP